MKLKFAIISKIAFVLATASSLSLAAAEVSPVSANESNFSQAAATDANNSGRIPGKLTKEPRSGYWISLQLKEFPDLNIRGALLTINGTHVKHKSFSTVKQMLRGPVGSSVDLQILTDRQERKTYTVRRQILEHSSDFKEQEKTAWTALKTRASFNGPDHWWMMMSARTEQDEAQNLDLVARSFKRLAVRAALQLPDEQNPEAYYAFSSAGIACDRLGDIDAANEYLKLALTKAGHGVIWIHQPVNQKKPLDNLLAVGRYKECQTLSKLGLAAEGIDLKQPFSDVFKRQIAMELASIYADAATQQNDKDASKAVSEDFEIYKKMQLAGGWTENLMQVGALFNRLGMHEQAIDALKKIGAPWDQLLDKPHLTVSDIAWSNSISYQLAQYQDSAGYYGDAIKTLTSANKIWQDNVSDAKNGEELALYFPAHSDVLLALAQVNLKNKQTTEAIANVSQSIEILRSIFGPNDFALREPLLVLAKALKEKGDLIQATKVELQASKLRETPQIRDYSELEKARMVRHAVSLIHDDKGAEAYKIAERLFSIYKEEGNLPAWPHPNVNLFCCLLNIARQLSDKHYYEESDRLLVNLLASVENQELSPSVLPFLVIEKSINAERQHKDTLLAWTDIAEKMETEHVSTNDSGTAIQNFHRQQNLRTIADFYLGAGENSRANLILAKSTHFQSERQHAESSPGTESAMEDSLLKMDYALLTTEQGDSKKGAQLAKEALSECPLKFLTVAAPKDYVFNDERDQQIVQKFEFKMQRLVESLILKNDLENSRNILAEFFQRSNLALETHETSTTIKQSDERKDWNKRVSDGTFQALMAKVLYQQGKPSEALEFVNLNVANDHIPPLSFYILAGDIANANELPGQAAHFYSEAEKTGINVVFAMDQDNPALHKSLLKQAATLAASDATFDKIEKANIFMRYALVLEPDDKSQCLDYLQKAYELVPDSDQRKADLLSRISRLETNSKPGSLTSDNQKDKSKLLIDSLHTAAKLAESSGRKDAFNYWFSLADAEATAGNTSDAITHAEHAISSLTRSFSPIEYRAPISAYSELTESLVKHNEYQNAEKIFVDALKKTKSLDGADSFSAAQQGMQLVLFYLNHQRDKDAVHTVRQLTTDCPRALEIGWPRSAITELTRAQRELFKHNRGEVSLQIYELLLKSNRQTFDTNDERIAKSLVELAAVEKTLKRDKEAEEYLAEASKIFKLYFSDSTTYARKYLGAVLTTFGIDGYADNRLECENTFFFPDIIMPLSERRAELQNHYAHVRLATPYGEVAEHDLNMMIGLAAESEDWAALADAAKARLAILEHKPDPLAGRQVGCVKTYNYRFRFYQEAIEANLHLGKKHEADELINRAEAHATAPSFGEMCKFAGLAYDCGDLKQSERLATRAENLMENETWEFQDLVKLWRKLGRESDAVAVEVKAKRIQDEYDARMQALDKGAFNHFNI